MAIKLSVMSSVVDPTVKPWDDGKKKYHHPTPQPRRPALDAGSRAVFPRYNQPAFLLPPEKKSSLDKINGKSYAFYA